jgi:putrescine transport system substrate-binding protein
MRAATALTSGGSAALCRLMNLHRLGYWVLAAMIGASPATGEEARVNVYNWSDYIAPDTMREIEAETGINVTYDVL